jgi:hypothetical protein
MELWVDTNSKRLEDGSSTTALYTAKTVSGKCGFTGCNTPRTDVIALSGLQARGTVDGLASPSPALPASGSDECRPAP